MKYYETIYEIQNQLIDFATHANFMLIFGSPQARREVGSLIKVIENKRTNQTK